MRIIHALVALNFFTIACGDVSPSDGDGGPQNTPPAIALVGPSYEAGSTVRIIGTSWDEIRFGPFWALVADADGLDDISAVFFEIASTTLHHIILRPRVGAGGCNWAYTADDVIDVDVGLGLPRQYPGYQQAPMQRVDGGLYQGPLLWFDANGPNAPPDFVNTAGEDGITADSQGYCHDNILEHLDVGPPLRPSLEGAVLTYVEAEYHGISVTAYDGAGASATFAFPDARIVFTTADEEATSP